MVQNQLVMGREAILRRYLETGKIVGTYRAKGEPRVEPWCDSAGFLPQFRMLYWDPNRTSAVKVPSGRMYRRLLPATLGRVTSAMQGDTLRGRVLYLGRVDVRLPKDIRFIQDLLGLTALDADADKGCGKLMDILKTGANDVYQVTSSEGKTHLVPLIPQVALERDPGGGVVKIRPIKGIFNDED